MWWNRIIFGIDGYEVVMWFLTYSMMGWLVESIYMSFCNHKITNRGFAKGPFCPIYGFGALTVFFILRPYSDNSILLFFLGSFLATTLEFLTALVMKRIFGEIWWDYHEKPFNYRGIICLESSIAWGFYTLFLFMFLQKHSCSVCCHDTGSCRACNWQFDPDWIHYGFFRDNLSPEERKSSGKHG